MYRALGAGRPGGHREIMRSAGHVTAGIARWCAAVRMRAGSEAAGEGPAGRLVAERVKSSRPAHRQGRLPRMCGAKCVPSQGRAAGDARLARRSAPVRRFRARVRARRCQRGRFARRRTTNLGLFGDFHFSEGGIGEFPCVFVHFRKVSAQSAPKALRTGVKGGINSPRRARRRSASTRHRVGGWTGRA